ncbi:MAG: glycosyltransferase family 4 protein [Vicinamibacterales bacterium]
MKVVFCWSGMQGYIASCLQALSRLPSLELYVIHLDFNDLPFQEELLAGIPNVRLLASEPNLAVPQMVVDQRPDIVFLCGWFYAPYRELLDRPELRSVKFVLGMDTPWNGSWRQRVNQFRLAGFITRMEKVVVAGPRTEEFARRLGARPGQVVRGLYGCDFKAFSAQGVGRLDPAGEWPKRFLFAGRYVPEKGLGVLLDAYRIYRSAVDDPWPLDCCGTGPDAARLAGQDGVSDLGYLQPSALPAVFCDHGVFVMPSLEEPWGVAIAEAAAAGLPLICSDQCGAADDVLRRYHNGLLVPAGDAAALAAAMKWMHEHHYAFRTMGLRSRRLASAFSAEAWAERMAACFRGVLAPAAPGAQSDRH